MIKIDPKHIYSAGEIARALNKKVPHVTEFIQRDRDKDGDDVLKSIKQGKGRQTKYFIKGKNLIKYLAEFGVEVEKI